MGTAATWMLSLSGYFLIAFVIRDLFHVMIHPEGRGSLSSWITSCGWARYAPAASPS